MLLYYNRRKVFIQVMIMLFFILQCFDSDSIISTWTAIYYSSFSYIWERL